MWSQIAMTYILDNKPKSGRRNNERASKNVRAHVTKNINIRDLEGLGKVRNRGVMRGRIKSSVGMTDEETDCNRQRASGIRHQASGIRHQAMINCFVFCGVVGSGSAVAETTPRPTLHLDPNLAT